MLNDQSDNYELYKKGIAVQKKLTSGGILLHFLCTNVIVLIGIGWQEGYCKRTFVLNKIMLVDIYDTFNRSAILFGVIKCCSQSGF